MGSTKFTLRLLVNTATNKVVFGEATKDAVDFLFSLLELPLCAIVKLLTKEKMVGAIGNLYQSVKALDTAYVVSTDCKAALVNPVVQSSVSNDKLLLPPKMKTCVKKYFRCSNAKSDCQNYIGAVSGLTCPCCKSNTMTKETALVDATEQQGGGGAGEGGYVKKMATFTISDELAVEPISNINMVALFNKCKVKDAMFLEERSVKLGFKEALELLKASLQSKTVLTDVFLAAPTSKGEAK